MRFNFPAKLIVFLFVSLSLIIATSYVPALAADLSIKTRTKFYSFRAKKFRQVSRQMLRHGPNFGRNGRRVWAKAHREYDWKLTYTKSRGKCAVKHAKVRMKITYTLPRLENEKRVSRRFRSKWKRVFRTLHRHEQTHGRNYKRLAKRLTRELRKLRPQRNCFALRRAAKKLDDKLHKWDIRRNRRFESGERARFTRLQRRIERG